MIVLKSHWLAMGRRGGGGRVPQSNGRQIRETIGRGKSPTPPPFRPLPLIGDPVRWCPPLPPHLYTPPLNYVNIKHNFHDNKYHAAK